jgi:hypothetical protein
MMYFFSLFKYKIYTLAGANIIRQPLALLWRLFFANDTVLFSSLKHRKDNLNLL